jgi:peptidoglycan/xylan/chitin deacetylase (PgdA/CDA1 family)
VRRRAGYVALAALLATLAVPFVAGATEPPITRVDNRFNRVAITFDACATKTHGYGFDRNVYRILQREQIPATIFISGRWGEFHARVMTELAADPLIEFGNHSYDHPHMARLKDSEIQRQIDETEAVLARFGKRSVAFRPPFGDISDRMIDVIRARGLPFVMWDVVSGDPAAATTASGMIHEVPQKTRSGSIIIFHINGRGRQTAAALPTILKRLRARGFQFVHMSELLKGDAAGGQPVAPAVASHPAPPTSAAMAFCDPPAPTDRVFPAETTPVPSSPPEPHHKEPVHP